MPVHRQLPVTSPSSWSTRLRTRTPLALFLVTLALLPQSDAGASHGNTLSVNPTSGLAGSSVTVSGTGWTVAVNPPYLIFWEAAGGTQLGSFNPGSGGNWSTSVTIPGGASPGGHAIVACEGYGIEFQDCLSVPFTVVAPSATPTHTPGGPTAAPTRTQTPRPTRTPTVAGLPTRTPTPTVEGCEDAIGFLQPLEGIDLEGVPTTDFVIDIIHRSGGELRLGFNRDNYSMYTRWPDVTAGTTVEMVEDPTSAGHYTMTIRDVPIPLGPNRWQVRIDEGTCLPRYTAYRGAYVSFYNGVAPTPTPQQPAEFDVHVRAVEVTQGIRGDVPQRTEDGDLVLRPDPAVHVAGRRTVVRVYPWMDIARDGDRSGGIFSARLHGTRGGSPLPGSPLAPVNRLYYLGSTRRLEEMRGNAAYSWNFLLPPSWVRDAGSLSLTIEVNPEGAEHVLECAGCDRNNVAYLSGIRFTEVNGIEVFPFLVRYTDSRGVTTQPTVWQMVSQLDWLWRTWPLPDFGMYLHWPRVVSYSGPLDDFGAGRFPFSDWSQYTYMPCVGPRVSSPTEDGCYYPAGTMYGFILPNEVVGCGGMAWYGWPWSESGGGCGPTIAQEFAHTVPLLHAGNSHGEAAGGGFDPAYPGPHGEVEANAYGFDVYALRAISPQSSSGHTHDFLSYGGGTQWVSLYTWQNLARFLGAPTVRGAAGGGLLFAPAAVAPEPATSQALRLAGRIQADGSITLAPAFLVQVPSGALDAEGQGSFQLVLSSRAGDVLVTRNLDPLTGAHGPTGGSLFFADVPDAPDLARVDLLQDGRRLARWEVSPHAPTVRLLDPRGGEVWGAMGEVQVQWEGSDEDGDALLYRLEVSGDDGETWNVVLGDVSVTSAALDLSTIPVSGDAVRVRVQASDGLRTALDEGGAVEVAAKAPLPLIFTPSEGAVFHPEQPIDLLGQAVDASEDRLAGSSLVWFLDGESIGTGEQLTVGALPIGRHTVSLRATNSAGLTGEATVAIDVTTDTDYDGLPDDWETSVGLDPIDPADAAADNDGDGLLNWEEFSFGTNPSAPDSDGDGHDDRTEIAGGGDPADPGSLPGHIHGSEAQLVQPPSQGATPSRTIVAVMIIGGVLIVLSGLGLVLYLRQARRGG